MTLSDLYAQIMAFDTRLQMLQDNNGGGFQSSANSASRGRGGSRGRSNNRGRGRGNGRGSGGRSNCNNFGGALKQGGKTDTVRCQISKKPNQADECWHRFEEDYQPKVAGSATTSYGVDTNWYVDNGATDHVTRDLKKITIRDRYNGQEQVHTTNGLGMKISNVGHSILHSPRRALHLKNILHVPSSKKSLASVHRLSADNNAYLEFHANYLFYQGSGHEENSTSRKM